MKTFKDLEFQGESKSVAKTAQLNFENGYGISVTEAPFFSGKEDEYCCSVLKDGDYVHIKEVPHETLQFITAEVVTERMGVIQKLN